MSPSWYAIDDIPFHLMVSFYNPDDPAHLRTTNLGQWPDVRLYFPPLIQSFRHQRQHEHLLARVDYGLVSSNQSSLPSLQSLGIDSEVDHAETTDLQEAIVAH